jgi:alkylhydroperoxidase family enzyme
MLRESMQTEGKQVDVRGVTQGFNGDLDVPHAAALIDFTEAVVLRDAARTDSARKTLRAALGEAGFVDAAAVVAAFHGFVRIADAIGIPYTTAARGRDVPQLREQAGINEFYRVRTEA